MFDIILSTNEECKKGRNDEYSDRFRFRKKYYCSSKPISHDDLLELADIVSWNIWQMDGLKFVVPMSCKPKVTKETLLDGTVETHIEECPGCSKKGNRQHFGTYCKVMDWNTGEPVEFRSIAENGGGHGK